MSINSYPMKPGVEVKTVAQRQETEFLEVLARFPLLKAVVVFPDAPNEEHGNGNRYQDVDREFVSLPTDGELTASAGARHQVRMIQEQHGRDNVRVMSAPEAFWPAAHGYTPTNWSMDRYRAVLVREQSPETQTNY